MPETSLTQPLIRSLSLFVPAMVQFRMLAPVAAPLSLTPNPPCPVVWIRQFWMVTPVTPVETFTPPEGM